MNRAWTFGPSGPSHPSSNVVFMQMTTQVTTEALRRLFSTPGPVASIYFDLSAPPEENAWARWHSMAGRLTRQSTDAATIKALGNEISASVPGSGVLAAIAANGRLLLAVTMPGSTQPDLAVRAPLPHLLPLLAWLQERPAHVLAVVDRTGAEITAYPPGATTAVTQTIIGPDDEIERNAPGGWSQMRYQHRAEDSWQHNAARVADALIRTLSSLPAQLLLLAGDVRALQYLTRRLPPPLRRSVTIHHVCGGRSPDGSVQDRIRQVEAETRRAAREQTRALLGRLAEERSPAGGSAEGVRDTLDALAHRRVRTLLVVDDPRDRRTGWFGPDAGQVSDRRDALAGIAGPLVQAPLADIAVRSAILTGADIRVLEPGTPGAPIDGIGALCRFPATRPEAPPAMR